MVMSSCRIEQYFFCPDLSRVNQCNSVVQIGCL